MATEASKVHFALDAKQVKQVPVDVSKDALAEFTKKLGFGFSPGAALDMARAYGGGNYAMDSIQTNVTPAAIPGLIQFHQYWMPGQVFVMTAAREIDNLVGISTMGEFSDEQIVQELLEQTGYARPYSDFGNVPLADWNLTFPYRTIVRFELGMRVGTLEEERSAKVRVNSGQAKRESCGENLEVTRNLIGFNGYNSGNNNTYGFLNDPGLPAIVNVANGASGSPEWSTKTFLEIQADLLTAFAQLRTQSKGNIDPKKTATVLALPVNAIDYLSTTSDFGVSVLNWMNTNYPMVRVESAIQLNTATGSGVGSGVFYLYAERVGGRSTDDGKTWVQAVPQKFRVLGVQKLTKGYQEDYANATAGVMLKRPWAVVRYGQIS